MKHPIRITTNSSDETISLAKNLASLLRKSDVLCLVGDLGAGKTTFVRGLVEGLKGDVYEVHSPTFVLMNQYSARLPIYHFDIYRLDDELSLDTIDLDEYLFGDGVAIVEWADKLGSFLPKEYLEITFEHVSSEKRAIGFRLIGDRYQSRLSAMKAKIK